MHLFKKEFTKKIRLPSKKKDEKLPLNSVRCEQKITHQLYDKPNGKLYALDPAMNIAQHKENIRKNKSSEICAGICAHFTFILEVGNNDPWL